VSVRPRVAYLLAVVALGSLVVPVIWVVLAAAAVLVAVGADILVARARPVVERVAPRVVARGVPAPLTLVAAPGLHTVVRQPAAAELEIDPREGVGGVEGLLVGRRRGRHKLPAPAARVDGPLGLGCWYRRCGEEAEIVVYPDVPQARRLARAARAGLLSTEGRRRGPLGLGTEFESVRDYQDDDDVRQINWPATQRLGRPMSNQYRVERERDVICVIDCGRLTAAPLGDRTRLDVALDAVAAVAEVADALGDRIGVVAFDDLPRVSLAPRRRGAKAVLAAVFDLEPRPVDSDYARAFAAVGGGKRALVLLFTDLVEEAAARPLLDAVPVLVRRHAVVVASVADEELEELVGSDPQTVVDVYRVVVANDVLGARDRVVAALNHAGAEVVTARPDEFAAACVRSYVRLKARALF
jgi:uncharacterized protein (DUF58 family)